MPTAIRSRTADSARLGAAYLRRNRVMAAAVAYFGGGLALMRFGGIDVLPPCLWKLLAGVDCPGCGLTTAMLHLLRLDPAAAYASNPLVFLVLPAVAAYLLQDLHRFRRSAALEASGT